MGIGQLTVSPLRVVSLYFHQSCSVRCGKVTGLAKVFCPVIITRVCTRSVLSAAILGPASRGVRGQPPLRVLTPAVVVYVFWCFLFTIGVWLVAPRCIATQRTCPESRLGRYDGITVYQGI